MKIVFVGGGSHRYLGVARSMLAVPGLMAEGEINLYDPAVARAEAVGRMIQKSPEAATAACAVRWGDSLDQALEGADIVYVVLMAGGRANHGLCESICRQAGFIASDQLSPAGAMLALKGGPILMDLAGRMERLCPQAWLVDFANPVAVLSAAVNNHTAVRCLGVCEGYANHQWDLTRMLYGRDEAYTDYEIRSAGVNHMSFILPGSTHRGRDIYELAAERIHSGWQMPALSDRWSEGGKRSIANNVRQLVHLYRKYGTLVFSSEGDGLAHLDMEKESRELAAFVEPTPAAREADEAHSVLSRQHADAEFGAWLAMDMDAETWSGQTPATGILGRVDEDAMVKIARALGGGTEIPVATSFPNRGAVRGFKDRTVLEYSQFLGPNGLRPAGEMEVPELFQGLVGALASHQTLLGDAIATRDPRILFEALYSYPVMQDSHASKTLWRDLLAAAGEGIPAEFARTRDYFCA